MRRGTCVKCASTTVRAAGNGIILGPGPSEQTGLRPHIGPGFRGAVRVELTDLWSFTCTTCGYVEMHLLDAGALAYVNANWLPVPTTPDN